MSICDRCIHDEVCGLEDNHEDAMTFCADMKPKDILDKIRAEIEQGYCEVEDDYDRGRNAGLYIAMQIIDHYKAERMDT